MNQINKSINSIMFNNQQKFIIPSGIFETGENIFAALSVNRNLESFGYTLDTASIKQLSTLSIPEITNIYKDMLDIIKDHLGVDEFTKTELFYPGFPEEVMEKSDAELYLNSLLYYSFSQTDDIRDKEIANMIRNYVTGEKTKRLPLLEKFPSKLKIISLASEQDFIEMMDNRIHSLNMSESQFRDLFVFQKYYPAEFNKMLSSDRPFQSKRNVVLIMKALYDQSINIQKNKFKEMYPTEDIKNFKPNYQNFKFKSQIATLSKDSKDILKFAALLSKDNMERKGKNVSFDVELRNGLPSFDLKPFEQRLIKDMLNSCQNIFYDVWRKNDKVLYERLRNRINPTKGPARVVKLFDNFSNNKKVDENGKPIKAIYRQIDDAIENLSDIQARNSLDYLASHFQGAFLRNYISYIEKAKAINPKYVDCVIDAAKLCDKTSVYDKIHLQNIISKRDDFGNYRYNKDGAGNIRTIKNAPMKLTPEEKEKAIQALQVAIDSQICHTGNLGKVYIDPELRNRIVPAREMKDCSEGPMVMPGSIMDIHDNKNLLIFAINWKEYQLDQDLTINEYTKYKKGEYIRADIDLHAAMLDENMNCFNEVYYGHLKTNYCCHSGDFTTATINNATEAIILDKSKLPKRCRYIVPSVVGFNIPFNLAKDVRFMMQEREGKLENIKKEEQRLPDDTTIGSFSMNGEIFEPSKIENPIKLNAAARSEIPCLLDVKENKIFWLDAANDNYSYYQTSSFQYEIWKCQHETRPNMYTLFMNYAMINGTELVDNIQEADTIFVTNPIDKVKENVKENAKIITSYELDTISANYAGNPQKIEKTKDLHLKTQENFKQLEELEVFEEKEFIYPNILEIIDLNENLKEKPNIQGQNKSEIIDENINKSINLHKKHDVNISYER